MEWRVSMQAISARHKGIGGKVLKDVVIDGRCLVISTSLDLLFHSYY